MINILFFGATSKLGRHWLKTISKKNTIYCNVHFNNKILKGKNIKRVKMNLENYKEINSFCANNNISIIINCIGLPNVEACQTYKKKALKINHLIPSQLCKIAKKLKIFFVHISTDMLFDGKSFKKYSERSKYNPINQYSKTKVKAEKFIAKYNKSLIIRANFFGIGEKNNMTISDKLIYEQKLKKKSYLWNNIYFTPIYIPNLIFFINLLIKKNSKGIFNISSNKGISKFDFAQKLTDKIIEKKKIFASNFDKKKFVVRPKNMCLDNQKLKRKFIKYKDKLTLKYQIDSFVRDYKLINES